MSRWPQGESEILRLIEAGESELVAPSRAQAELLLE